MNKTIITELKRAREIMGLNVGELLNEQPTKLLGKILNTFSRTTLPKEAAEKLAIRLSKLLSKSEGTALTNVFDRMNSNIVLGPNGGKYLVSATGTNFPFSNIERIISLVASGKFGIVVLENVLSIFPNSFVGCSFSNSPTFKPIISRALFNSVIIVLFIIIFFYHSGFDLPLLGW